MTEVGRGNKFQASIKFTNEPPQGIKAGLKRTYTGMTQDFLDFSDLPQWKPLLYGVSFLHCVVQVTGSHSKMGLKFTAKRPACSMFPCVSGASQVRTAGLERPVRVQLIRLVGEHPVLSEPPRRN